ncbi:MAG: hypothetical protein GWP14_01985 [Actinobacteria bacterium]|nr:hypothetical protein [Actinomycetota bacterium]
MRPSRFIGLGVLCSVILVNLMGCRSGAWRKIHIGQTTRAQIENIFQTSIGPKERYIYGLSKDELSGNKTLIMASLDNNGVAIGKYYWHWEPQPTFELLEKDSWHIYLETRIAPLELQGFSPTAESREEAILEHFGQLLFDTSRQFDHLNEVAEIMTKMNQILAMAINQYGRQTKGHSVLDKGGLAFDGQGYGNKCSMALKVVDENRGLYRLTLKGRIEN